MTSHKTMVAELFKGHHVSRALMERPELDTLAGGVTRLVTRTVPAVINWMCVFPYALLGLSLPGGIRLFTLDDDNGCHKLNHVLTHNNNVSEKCQPYTAADDIKDALVQAGGANYDLGNIRSGVQAGATVGLYDSG
jgi:hypothetical protein